MSKENISENPLLTLKDPEARNRILERGKELVGLVRISNFETLVFIDRSARPISWIFDAFWIKLLPNHVKPESLFINLGQKDLRTKYMKGIGSAVGMTGNQFVGRFDTQENIALFKQRVRADKDAKARLQQELGEEEAKKLRGRQVLIIDEWEFEGVSRLFAEEIIDDVYKPRLIKYWEWGADWDFYDIPTGLSESRKRKDRSFIAKPAKRPENIAVSQLARQEVINIASELTRPWSLI